MAGATVLFFRCLRWLKAGELTGSIVADYVPTPVTEWVGLDYIIQFFFARDILIALFVYPVLILCLGAAIVAWVRSDAQKSS